MKAFAIVALAAPALSAAIPRIELDMAEEPTMSANKWCNGDKTFVSGMESKKYSGTDECTGLCRNNDACEWVGYRKYDKYCEFWTSGSCQNPHDQSGHDIYHVTTSTTTTTTPAATTTTAAAAATATTKVTPTYTHGAVASGGNSFGSSNCPVECKSDGKTIQVFHSTNHGTGLDDPSVHSDTNVIPHTCKHNKDNNACECTCSISTTTAAPTTTTTTTTTAAPTTAVVDPSTITAVTADYMKTQTGNSNWDILKSGNNAVKTTSPLTAFSRIQPKGNPTHFLAVCGNGQNKVCMSKDNPAQARLARWFGFSASGEIAYSDWWGPAPQHGCFAGTWWHSMAGKSPAKSLYRTGYPCLGHRGYGGYKPEIAGPDTSSKYDQGASKWQIVKGPIVSGVQYFKLKILSTACQVAGCGDDIAGECLRTPLSGGATANWRNDGDVAAVAPCQDTDDFLWSAENWNLNA